MAGIYARPMAAIRGMQFRFGAALLLCGKPGVAASSSDSVASAATPPGATLMPIFAAPCLSLPPVERSSGRAAARARLGSRAGRSAATSAEIARSGAGVARTTP